MASEVHRLLTALVGPPAAVTLAAVVAAVAGGAPAGVVGAPADVLRTGPSGAPGDSMIRVEVLVARARERQRELERLRRRRLPRSRGGSGDSCHEWLGRFCLWLGDDDGEAPELAPEPEEVIRKRRELVAFLDTVGRRAPRDEWVAGQRVRYLVEAGQGARAVKAARGCEAEAAWCAALEGYALHHRGRFREAGEAFRRALVEMEPGASCRWRSLSLLYRDQPVEGYGGTSCEGRRSMEGRIWHLADPLYLTPGNERLTEHYSRHVMDRMQEGGTASAFGESWGEDLRELLVRYGWPRGFERTRPRSVRSREQPAVEAHYPHWGVRYLPPATARTVDGIPVWPVPDDGPGMNEPVPAPAAEWELEPYRPTSEYGPAYLREEMAGLPHLVSRFRRGDTALVVAAWELPRSAENGRRVRSGLFVEPGGGGPPYAVQAAETRAGGRPADVRRAGAAPGPRSADAASGTFALAVPAGSALLSLEAWVPADSVAARHRRGVMLPAAPEEGLALSDLLLLGPTADTLPDRLEEVRRLALPRPERARGRGVGLYWEVYGPDVRGARLRTAVELTRRDGGFFRKVGKLLGVAGEREPSVRAEWDDRAEPGLPFHARSLVIRLPADLPTGDYRLSVTVRASGGAPLTVERELRVVESG